MANLVIPRREIWTQQPRQFSGIDKGNRFGSRVDSWYLASEFKAKQASIITPNGVATDFSSQYVIGNSPSVAGRPFTLVFVFTMPVANVGAKDSVYVGSGNGFRASPYTSSGGMYWPWTANGVANGEGSPRDASGVFDNRKIVLVSDWTATGQTSWWKRDGVDLVSWSDTFGYIPPTDLSVKIGQSGNGAAKFLAAYVLEGNVGAQGAAEIIKNPWQIFAPRETRLFVPVSSIGGSYTLTAQAGIYSLTGQPAQLLKSKLLTSSGGTYQHVGADASLYRSRQFSLSGGSYSISGASADITFTGLSANYILTAQGGIYSLVGSSADIIYTALSPSYLLTAQGGTYTLSGNSIDLRKSKRLTASGGGYSYTGQQVNITAGPAE